jgi:hypothetical protein
MLLREITFLTTLLSILHFQYKRGPDLTWFAECVEHTAIYPGRTWWLGPVCLTTPLVSESWFLKR